MRKKCLSAVLVSILLFCACDARKDQTSSVSSIPPAPSQASSSSIQDTPTAETLQLSFLNPYDGCGTKDGFYRLEQFEGDKDTKSHSNIMYFDYATRREIYLCNKPDCKHDNENCTSYLPGEEFNENSLFCDQSRLYLLSSGFGGNDVASEDAQQSPQIMEAKPGAPTLYSMSFDGSNRTKLLEMPSGLEVTRPYVMGGNVLYLAASTSKLKQDGSTYTYEKVSQDLIRIDLTEKKIETVCPIPFGKEFYQMVSAYEDQIVFVKTVYPEDPNQMDDASFRTMSANATTHIVTMNPATGKETEHFSGSQQELFYYTCDQNKIYFANSGERSIQTLDLKTNQVTLLTDQLPRSNPGLSSQISDGKLQIQYYEDKELNSQIEECYFIDLETGKLAKQNLYTEKPREPVRILDELDDAFLVISHYDAQDNYYAAFGVTQTDISKTYYALISKQDYWNSAANYLPIEGARKEG